MDLLTHAGCYSFGGQFDGHVAGALADPGGAAERARTVALERRALVHEGPADPQLVGDELVVVLRVGDRGVQKLQDVPRGGARRVREYGTRVVRPTCRGCGRSRAAPCAARCARTWPARARSTSPSAIAPRGASGAAGGVRHLGAAPPASLRRASRPRPRALRRRRPRRPPPRPPRRRPRALASSASALGSARRRLRRRLRLRLVLGLGLAPRWPRLPRLGLLLAAASASPRPRSPAPPPRRLGLRRRSLPCSPRSSHPRLVAAGVAAEQPRGSELAQLVADHRLGDEHRHVLAAVVHGDRVAHHLREDRGRRATRS